MYNNNSNTQYSHSGPLFSQPFDPSTLNVTSDSENMIPSSMDAWDFYSQQVNTPESILLSDPNFLRQHQLLQEQQKEMHTRLTHDDERHEQVSNLTAMFEPVVKIEEDKKLKKTQNRRQQIVTTNNNYNNNDDDDDTVDHQRRFNELQARFRVNYARKQVNHVKATNNKPVKPQAEPIIQLNNKATTLPPPPPPPPLSSSLSSAMTVINNSEENTELLSSSFPSRTMPIQIQRVSRLNSSQPFDAESHQKQLDNQLDKVDFEDITVSELKEMLRQRGKPATGKKAVLLQRLQEEREISKGGRSAGSFGSGASSRLLSNRHSQPAPRSVNINSVESPQRPRSFQSSSPVMIQATNNNNNHNYNTTASPASPGTSLHRSIANMHIGSPPTSSISRRYSPYSPRLSSSPKPVHHEYSSSVPLSSSPTNSNNVHSLPNNNMMLSSSYSSKPSCRFYNNPKTYKPFMSSALATPDREEDVNPFDAYYNTPIKEEVIDYDPEPIIKQEPMPDMDDQYNISLDWVDPTSFDILLQQQQQQQGKSYTK